MSRLVDLSIGITRIWASAYTRGLPHDTRAERREEIDSDLWEQQRLAARRGDPAVGAAIEVLMRMLLGVVSDITWRAQAGASARADRGKMRNEALYMRGLVAVGVVVALLLILGYWTLLITIPIGIAMGIEFFRVRRTGGAVGIGVDRMRTKGESRWKWLLLVIGVCVVTVVGMWSYALSLEEWGDARTMIFGLGSLLAVTTGFMALLLLISDLLGSARRKTDS